MAELFKKKVVPDLTFEQIMEKTRGGEGQELYKPIIYQGILDDVEIRGLARGSEMSIQGWQSDLVFSATDDDTVAWASGTITLTDGTEFAIGAGNTGNMSALTYIYLDRNISEIALQTSTTATDAVGLGKIIIAVAQNNDDATSSATFQVFGGQGGMLITTENLAANTVTANEITVNNLAAISADLGACTAGTMTIDASGYIRGGQTAYNTGTGFFLGYDTTAYKFSIGNPAGDNLRWDGTNLIVNNSRLLFGNLFGDGSDGDTAYSANATLDRDMYYDDMTISNNAVITADGYRIFCKGTLTVGSGCKVQVFAPQSGGNAGDAHQGSPWDGGAAGAAGAASARVNQLHVYTVGPAGKVGGEGMDTTPDNAPGVGIAGAAATGYDVCVGGGNGKAGGAGGDGGGADNKGAAAGAGTGTVRNGSRTVSPFVGSTIDGTSIYQLLGYGGTGGSGSGGGGQNGGAGGGSAGGGGSGGTGAGAGTLVIIAKSIVLAGTLEAIGGDGGDGGDGANADAGTLNGGGGGGAGGSGGSGGLIYLVYGNKTGAGSTDVSGGAAGAIGTGGTGSGGGANGDNATAANAGNDGIVIELVV